MCLCVYICAFIYNPQCLCVCWPSRLFLPGSLRWVLRAGSAKGPGRGGGVRGGAYLAFPRKLAFHLRENENEFKEKTRSFYLSQWIVQHTYSLFCFSFSLSLPLSLSRSLSLFPTFMCTNTHAHKHNFSTPFCSPSESNRYLLQQAAGKV